MLLKFSSLIVFLLFSLTPCLAEQSRSSVYQMIEKTEDLVKADPKKVIKQLKNIESEAKKDKATYLLWLIRLIQGYNYSYQFDLFSQTTELGVSLLDDETEPKSRVLLLIYNGILHQRRADYETAFTILWKACRLSKKYGLSKVETLAQIEISYTYALAEQFETALVILQQAYMRAKKFHFPLLEAQVNEVYGVTYNYMGKPEESISYYSKAINFYKTTGYPYFIAEGVYGKATTYRYWKKWDEAIQGFDEYREVITKFRSDFAEFYYLYGKGMSLAAKGDCIEALKLIEQGIQKTELTDYIAEFYKKQAVCRARTGNFSGADQSLQKAKDLFDEMPKIRGTTWDIETVKISSEIAFLKGDNDKAYNELNDYYQLLLKIKEKNSSKSFQELKLNLFSQREKLETALLEKESQAQKLELVKKSREIVFQRFLLIAAIFFITIILSWLWWQSRVSKKLKALSVTDDLTGLFNRRYIFSAIENILKNKTSKQFHHSLMLIDLDNLKPINDDHGHQDGDKALKTVAEVGSSISRAGDVFARIGGDEFMLLLTRSSQEIETAIAKRIIETVKNSSITTDSGEEVFISVSVGVVTVDNPSESIESLYSRVDEALYRAKSAGRNRYSK